MLDPLVSQLITLAFCLLFLTAGHNKLNDRLRFQGILTAYQLLPAVLVPLFSFAIPLLELSLGLGWIFAAQQSWVAIATALLLYLYGAGMAINLMRGRTYIDCGCGFSSRNAQRESNGTQQLSVWLVARNAVLAMLALLTLTGTSARSLVALDYFSLVASLVLMLFLYAGFHQLLVNNNTIASWRKPLVAKTGARHD